MTVLDTNSSLPLLLLQRVQAKLARMRLKGYQPYAKQAQFHAAGATKRERLLRAGNQMGKTWAGAAEMAMHLTGQYPDWWTGRRWDRPIKAWAGGKDGMTVRDTIVQLLCGPPGERGTGYIPGDALVDISPARGIADGVDSISVRHVSGGLSRVTFKTYDQGRERWQGATLDLVWFDEEPPSDIYSEGLTRTNATGGIVYMTFTPLLGMSEVVMRFLGKDKTSDRHDTNITIDDALHIPAEKRQQIIDSYRPHEREARIRGTPMQGEGLIFPISEASISVEPMPIPKHWAQLGALDFGWQHPTAAVRIAWDRDNDRVWIVDAYSQSEQPVPVHAAALRRWGREMLWAWPRDGLNDTAVGLNLAAQYRNEGLRMLQHHAQFEDGSVSVEAGISEMLTRMQTGRLKVFRTLSDWFEEFRLYHREDGKVVKLRDDLMSATRYGIMSLRYATTPQGALRHGANMAQTEYDLYGNG